MGKFLRIMGLGFGLSSGAGLAYLLYSNEKAQVVAILLGGYLLAVVTILVVVAVVLRFSRQPPESKLTYHQRFDLPPPGYWSPNQPYPQASLPPVEYLPPGNGKYNNNDEDEIVA